MIEGGWGQIGRRLSRVVSRPVTQVYDPIIKTNLDAAAVAKLATESAVAWAKAGFKLVSDTEHNRRFNQCTKCPHYRYFLCQKCRCVIFVKSKLAGVRCPDQSPRW